MITTTEPSVVTVELKYVTVWKKSKLLKHKKMSKDMFEGHLCPTYGVNLFSGFREMDSRHPRHIIIPRGSQAELKN